MSSAGDLENRLLAAASLSDRGERTVQVAVVLAEALRAAGDRPVLVGGAAVEIYTRSMYTTVDFDFIAAGGPKVASTLRQLGFERRGRVWVRRDLAIVVELPSATLSPARSVSMRVGSAELEIIAVEDLIVDRLAAWKHWKWHPDGVAAGLLLGIHDGGLDKARLLERAQDEQVADALASLREILDVGDDLSGDVLAAAHAKLEET